MDNPRRTLLFTAALCLGCSLILAFLASSLKERQEAAVRTDRYREMLISVQYLDRDDYFLLDGKRGRLDKENLRLVADESAERASAEEITSLYEHYIRPKLANAGGEIASFEERGLVYQDYLQANAKYGYHKLPWKLYYEVSSLEDASKVSGIIIPVQGFGLWGPIYGLLALKNDGNTVLGISWYSHAETPGLGANISTDQWQSQFPGKQVFQVDAKGNIDPKKAVIGITVLRGRVQDTLSGDPRARHSVDGMSGATITGNGVSSAYKETLESYRSFLIKKYEAAR